MRLAPYLRAMGVPVRDRWIAAGLVLGNLVTATMLLIDPVLFGRVIGLLARSAALAPETLRSEAVRLLGAWIAIGVTGIATNVGVALFADRFAHRNRLAAISRFSLHILALPPSFHAPRHSGLLMKQLFAGVDAMFWFWLGMFREQLCTGSVALLLLPLALALNWRLGLVLLALVVLFCGFALMVSRRTLGGQQTATRYQTALAAATQDAVGNVVMLQAFGHLPQEQRRFAAIMADVLAHQYPVLTWWAIASASARAASTLAVIAIVVVGTWLHLRGQASVGEIVSCMGFATLLIGRLDGAMQFSARLFYELPHLAAYFAVIDTASSVPERAGARELAITHGAEVRFEDVSFAFPGGAPALSNISFAANAGRVVALVGHTGAGKSTAMALLQRQWDPQVGRVLIDGQDVRDVTLTSLRRAIGVVFQDSMLLNRSIRDNLLVGRPQATEAEITAACRLADAEEFIIRQPFGLDTLVGERGAGLSGGQRQRLAIARAALKDPPILILDEATSALDAATEARVSAALQALMAGRTTFVIAHRLSTVRDADEILVFDAGRIVERGRFADLLAAGGRFAELVATQLAGIPDPELAAVPRAAE